MIERRRATAWKFRLRLRHGASDSGLGPQIHLSRGDRGSRFGIHLARCPWQELRAIDSVVAGVDCNLRSFLPERAFRFDWIRLEPFASVKLKGTTGGRRRAVSRRRLAVFQVVAASSFAPRHILLTRNDVIAGLTTNWRRTPPRQSERVIPPLRKIVAPMASLTTP